MYQPGSNIDPATTSGAQLADMVEDLGFVTRGTVKSRTSAQPGSPVEGDAYIVNADASWGGSEHDVALYTDAWRYLTPEDGWTFRVTDEDKVYRYDAGSGSWVSDHEERTIELGGDFDAGGEVKCVRNGIMVTITSIGVLTHSDAAAASQSALNVLPASLRPASADVSNVYHMNTSGDVRRVTVTTTGEIQTHYRDSASSAMNDGTTEESFSITYAIA